MAVSMCVRVCVHSVQMSSPIKFIQINVTAQAPIIPSYARRSTVRTHTLRRYLFERKMSMHKVTENEKNDRTNSKTIYSVETH